jgi:hypothetical protein
LLKNKINQSIHSSKKTKNIPRIEYILN